MDTKILLAMILILAASVVTWGAVSQRSTATSVAMLTQRVEELEVRNVHLEKQLLILQGPTAVVLAESRNRVSQMISEDSKDEQTAWNKPELETIDNNIRQELATIVEQKRAEANQKRRDERQKKMRLGVRLSVKDFVEDHNLDEYTAEKITPLFDRAYKQRFQLRKDMESQNISLYEYRKESRKIQENLEDELAEFLTADEFKAFQDTFPRRY